MRCCCLSGTKAGDSISVRIAVAISFGVFGIKVDSGVSQNFWHGATTRARSRYSSRHALQQDIRHVFTTGREYVDINLTVEPMQFLVRDPTSIEHESPIGIYTI